MTRFTTTNGVFYTDTKTGWEFQSYGEVVKLLNDLADENEQLKKDLTRTKVALDSLQETYSELLKIIPKE